MDRLAAKKEKKMNKLGFYIGRGGLLVTLVLLGAVIARAFFNSAVGNEEDAFNAAVATLVATQMMAAQNAQNAPLATPAVPVPGFPQNEVDQLSSATADLQGQLTQASGDNTMAIVTGYPVYAVLQNDTLTSIAAQYSTTVAEIKAANRLASDVILVGQLLTIPVVDTDNGCRSFDECGGFVGTLHPDGLQWVATNEDTCVLGTPSGTALPGIPGIDFGACFGFNQFAGDSPVEFSVDWAYTDQDLAEKMYDWVGQGEQYVGVAWWGPEEGAYARVSYNGAPEVTCHSFEVVANENIHVTFVNENTITSAVWGFARMENAHLPECMAP